MVSARLDEHVPRKTGCGEFFPVPEAIEVADVPQDHRRRFFEHRSEPEIAVDAGDRNGVLYVRQADAGRILGDIHLFECVLVESPSFGMVVAQQFEAENAEEDRVGDEIFERDHAPAVILHRPVRTFRKRCRIAECDRFDRQFVAQPAHLVVAVEYIVAKHENVFRVVSQWRVDQVACLRIDGQRGGEHCDGDCVLNDDQHFAVYLLRAVSQRSAHDVHGFVAGYQRRRHDARNEAQREQEQCVPCDPLRCRCRRDVDLRAEQPCGVGFGRFGQQKGDGECRAAHQSRFEDQFEHDFPFRRAQQAARGHLLGAESGLCGRQVDVVDDGEEQDDNADCHEDRHERAVARREVPVAVEGRKIDLPQGQERYLPVNAAGVRPIDRFEIVEHIGDFGPQVGPFACQQKGAARPGIAHAFVVIVLLRQ